MEEVSLLQTYQDVAVHLKGQHEPGGSLSEKQLWMSCRDPRLRMENGLMDSTNQAFMEEQEINPIQLGRAVLVTQQP